MADRSTFRVFTARLWEVARVEALSIDTGAVAWAVIVESAALNTFIGFTNVTKLAFRVLSTFRRWSERNRLAVIIWVALIVLIATTLGTMKDWRAVRVLTARCVNRARIDTFGIYAGFIESTITITTTSDKALAILAYFTRVAGSIGNTLVLLNSHTVVALANMIGATITIAKAFWK